MTYCIINRCSTTELTFVWFLRLRSGSNSLNSAVYLHDVFIAVIVSVWKCQRKVNLKLGGLEVITKCRLEFPWHPSCTCRMPLLAVCSVKWLAATALEKHFNSTSASGILPLVQCPGSSVYPPTGTVPCLICVSSHWYSALAHLCILLLVQCPASSVYPPIGTVSWLIGVSSHWYSALAHLCILLLVQCPASSVVDLGWRKGGGI